MATRKVSEQASEKTTKSLPTEKVKRSRTSGTTVQRTRKDNDDSRDNITALTVDDHGNGRNGGSANDPEIEERIRTRAYYRYLERKDENGDPVLDWLEAEREVLK